jgi:hypothetical protein
MMLVESAELASKRYTLEDPAGCRSEAAALLLVEIGTDPISAEMGSVPICTA